jgi:hypothetical protein
MLYGVDPNMAMAVAAHESKLNERAVGALGEIGLMQLRPEYFSKSCKSQGKGAPAPCGQELFNPAVNLDIGIRNLAELQRSCRHKADGTWVICHNLGVVGGSRIQRPKEFGYYKLVMAEYDKIKKQRVFNRPVAGQSVATYP